MKKVIIAAMLALIILSAKANDYLNEFVGHLQNGELGAAELFLNLWEAAEPSDPELFTARAYLLLNSGNDSLMTSAIDVYDNALALYPARLDFLTGKAYAASLTGQLGLAYDITKELMLTSSDKQWLWTDNSELSTEEAQTAIDELFAGLVNTLYSQQSANANDMLKDILSARLENNPQDADALAILGALAFNDGDADRAVHLMQQSLEYKPNNFNVLVNLAHVQAKTGLTEDAKATYRRCLDLPDLSEQEIKYVNDMLDYMEHGTSVLADYDFEFRFIPPTAANLPVGTDAVATLMDPQSFVTVFMADKGWRLREDFGDIKADKFGSGDETAVVWTMPMPTEMPLARYIAFVPGANSDGYSVYFLEKSIPFDNKEIWVLGHSSPEILHTNYGDIPYPETAHDFLKAVQTVVE